MEKKKEKQYKKIEIEYSKKLAKETIANTRKQKRLERLQNKTRIGNELTDISDLYSTNDKNKKKDKTNDDNDKNYRTNTFQQDRITKFGKKQYQSLIKISKDKHKALRKKVRNNTKRKARHVGRRK